MRPYYERDGITLYCCPAERLLPVLAEHSVPLVLTDPPYEQEAHTLGRRQRRSGVVQARPLDFEPITSDLRALAGREFQRIAAGWVLVFCQVEAAMLWRRALEPDIRYMRTQIWRKPDGAPQFTGDRPGMGYESIVTGWSGSGRSWWNGGGRHGVYEHLTVRNGTGHTTEKPLALMRELVSLFSRPGDLVVDPFMGSGTTARACKDLGRRFIGCEIEERWCQVAVRRLAQEVLPLEMPA